MEEEKPEEKETEETSVKKLVNLITDLQTQNPLFRETIIKKMLKGVEETLKDMDDRQAALQQEYGEVSSRRIQEREYGERVESFRRRERDARVDGRNAEAETFAKKVDDLQAEQQTILANIKRISGELEAVQQQRKNFLKPVFEKAFMGIQAVIKAQFGEVCLVCEREMRDFLHLLGKNEIELPFSPRVEAVIYDTNANRLLRDNVRKWFNF